MHQHFGSPAVRAANTFYHYFYCASVIWPFAHATFSFVSFGLSLKINCNINMNEQWNYADNNYVPNNVWIQQLSSIMHEPPQLLLLLFKHCAKCATIN